MTALGLHNCFTLNGSKEIYSRICRHCDHFPSALEPPKVGSYPQRVNYTADIQQNMALLEYRLYFQNGQTDELLPFASLSDLLNMLSSHKCEDCVRSVTAVIRQNENLYETTLDHILKLVESSKSG